MNLLAEHGLFGLTLLAVAVSVVMVLHQPRSPQASAAWILFLILLPYVAVPLFVLLGFRKESRRYRPLLLPPPAERAAAATAIFTDLGCTAPAGGNAIAFHDGPEAARRALEEVLASAQVRVDVLLYILADDASGRAFVAQLTALAQRGVQVRLCIDGLGSLKRPRRALEALRAAGGEVRVFSPFPAIFDRGRLNLRNHRKLVMADAALVWSGGRNVGDHYIGAEGTAWRDLSFTLQGPMVAEYAAVFVSDWEVARGKPGEVVPKVAPAGDAVLQLVPAGPDERHDRLHSGLVAAIHRADRRVWLATPYFIPTEALYGAISTAAKRGVDVRLMIPQKSDQWTADLARGGYLRKAERAGAKVLRMQGPMLHAKVGLVDGLGWAGSANFDVRSMLLNFETTLLCHDAGTVDELERWFLAHEAMCEAGAPKVGVLRRLAENIVRLGAPVL
jgi:cardiolipin synthase